MCNIGANGFYSYNAKITILNPGFKNMGKKANKAIDWESKKDIWKSINETLIEAAKKFGFNKDKAKLRILTGNRNFFAIVEFNNEDESPNEETGPCKDLSFGFFPIVENNILKSCVVSLGLGSEGFENDRNLAHRPGTRRLFKKLKCFNKKTWLKSSFEETSTYLEELNKDDSISNEKAWLDSKMKYNSANRGYILAATLIEFEGTSSDKPSDWDEKSEIVNAWLATYAKMRGWATNNNQRDAIKKVLEQDSTTINEIDEIKRLLDTRKYVVLQGAPGTGKTYTAVEKIAPEYQKVEKNVPENKKNVFFIQFHAETTYSDFVWGIRPKLGDKTEENNSTLQFKPVEGVLIEAIKQAVKLKEEEKKEKVLLIIDEINRANLPNVLGPVFYLFEPTAEKRGDVRIKIGEAEYEKLPDNLHVLATMNTADRSLAVVDFALRRRFAWYTLRPKELDKSSFNNSAKTFMTDYYKEFDDIFQEFATDEELNLQPGHSYFIVNKNNKDKDNEMKERLRYELMPLIKEYLAEGFLLEAKDRFYNLFLKYDVEMYE